MPETKYTTNLYLAVRNEDAEQAGQAAVGVYQDFLGRLHRAAPAVKNLRLAIEAPAPRKGSDGVFECVSNLLASVPHELNAAGALNHHDAWRTILKTTFNYSCHHNHEVVHHTSSRVGVTRLLLAADEAPEAAAPVDAKPKVLVAVKVILNGQEYNVEIPKNENLLDGVNDKGVAVKWDCKSGVCDTCKVKVLKGMENLSAPNDNEQNMLGDLVKQGYRLSCQVVCNGPADIQQG